MAIYAKDQTLNSFGSFAIEFRVGRFKVSLILDIGLAFHAMTTDGVSWLTNEWAKYSIVKDMQKYLGSRNPADPVAECHAFSNKSTSFLNYDCNNFIPTC